MIERFKDFARAQCLIRTGEKVLLAVSGGADSVVMTHLFAESGIGFGVAHCNFQLRGEESEGDELFVRDLAKRLDAAFFSTRFDVSSAMTSGESVQMAARRLRYEWLEQIREKSGFAVIATAHHLDDSVETAVHNFVRGTGVSGLRGILPRSGRLARPMLFARKEEVLAYAAASGIAFREDSTNPDPKYTRNRIRNTLLPMLRDFNPGFDESMGESMRHYRDTELMQLESLDKLRRRLLTKRHSDWFIPIRAVKKISYRRTLLYELIRPFGFNSEQVDDILHHLDGQPGKVFETNGHRLIKDRRFLIVTSKDPGTASWLQLQAEDEMVHGEAITLRASKVPAKGFVIEPSTRVASLDLAKLQFPLTLRKWKQGDYFFPFGMKGKKKVSKFFKDEKIPISEKERIWILLSGEQVVWVVGYRIDNRFRVADSTESVYRLEVIT
jgi:tRNA(Ile)-lysidine synthase